MVLGPLGLNGMYTQTFRASLGFTEQVIERKFDQGAMVL